MDHLLEATQDRERKDKLLARALAYLKIREGFDGGEEVETLRADLRMELGEPPLVVP